MRQGRGLCPGLRSPPRAHHLRPARGGAVSVSGLPESGGPRLLTLSERVSPWRVLGRAPRMESASAGACNLSGCLCPWSVVSGSGRSGHSDNAVFSGVRPSAGARVARGQERHSAALSSRRLGTQALRSSSRTLSWFSGFEVFSSPHDFSGAKASPSLAARHHRTSHGCPRVSSRFQGSAEPPGLIRP